MARNLSRAVELIKSFEGIPDGDPATVDRCVPVTPTCGALCVHDEGACDYLDPADVQQARCDDGDPCTLDACAFPSHCAHTAIPACSP